MVRIPSRIVPLLVPIVLGGCGPSATERGLHTVTLQHEPGLTGNSYDGNDTPYSFLLGGDTPTGSRLYGGMSFSLRSLPSLDRVIEIQRAELHGQVIRMVGEPRNPALRGYLLDHVAFSGRPQIDDALVLDEAFATMIEPLDVAVGVEIVVDVQQPLADSWAADSPYLQLRFYAETSTDDGIEDGFHLRRGAEENPGNVADGLPEPDPDHAVRLEIEYLD